MTVCGQLIYRYPYPSPLLCNVNNCEFVSQLDDEQEASEDAAFAEQLENEFDNMDEQFLREYRQKRLEELRKAYEAV